MTCLVKTVDRFSESIVAAFADDVTLFG